MLENNEGYKGKTYRQTGHAFPPSFLASQAFIHVYSKISQRIPARSIDNYELTSQYKCALGQLINS